MNTFVVTIVSTTILIAVTACGVRGRPQPPLTPPELGRGQPTFTHGSEEFAVPYVPPVSEATPTPTPTPTEGTSKEKK